MKRTNGMNASMRPRLLHLGYKHNFITEEICHEASMRPRLLHLGYSADRVRAKTPKTLQ